MMFNAQIITEAGFEVAELKGPVLETRIAVNIGNTLFSLKDKGEELLYFPFTLEEYRSNSKLAGNPFMHPWANRLEGYHIRIGTDTHNFPDSCRDLLYRDNHHQPLHGLLLKTDQWKTTAIGTTDVSAYHEAELIFDNADWLAIFPFLHVLRMKQELFEDHLSITLSLSNAGEKSLPISFGFHPYFLIDPAQRSSLRLSIPAKELIETDGHMIPTGRAEAKETFFPFRGNVLLLGESSLDHGFQHLQRNEQGEAIFALEGLKVSFDEHYAFAQVYAPPGTDKPYVCIEPMTAATNALNRQTCRHLAPGQTYRTSFSIHFP